MFFITWEDKIDLMLSQWVRYTLLGLVVFGFLIILLGILNLNENIAPFSNPKKKAGLISNGIYGYVRHPIYLGIIIAMFSYSFYTLSIVKLLISIVLVVALYFKTNYEEKFLMKNFSDYKNYKETTGRFFPKKYNRKS